MKIEFHFKPRLLGLALGIIWVLFLVAPSANAQNFIQITASNISSGTTKLPSGSILFQAVGTAGQAISYQVGGGGQQISVPTVCGITNGVIAPACLLANVALTQPQNLCFQTTVKTSSGQIVLGGNNKSGYQCVQPLPNNAWCTAAICDFDNYTPNLPSTILTIQMPLPYPLSLGGLYSGDCAPGTVVIGYNSTGHPDCGSGGGGSSVWGGITGLITNQTDLAAALALLAPVTSPNFLGAPTVPEPSLGDNSTAIPNTAWVNAQGYAPLNSPVLTGTPTAPTPLTADSSQKLATTAWVNAQNYSTGSGNVNGPSSSGINNIAGFGSTNGKTLVDLGFGFPLSNTHIGTLVAGSNGLAASATTDATNAVNISSGILSGARLPMPSSTVLGGIKSYTAVAHQWINSISTAGAAVGSQPTCADISNASSSCSIDATNASNLVSGTLSIARLGTLIAGQNGLAASATLDATNASNISTGTLNVARLGTLVAGSNGLVASATTDTTNASNISSGTLAAARLPATVAQLNPPITLTFGSTITWAIGSVPVANAAVTMTGNATLAITGPRSGGSYLLQVTQDATGSRTLALGSGCSPGTWLVANGGHGIINLTPTPGATDVVSFYYNGANCIAALIPNVN